ncbi:MAG: class I SAM-dependent methyltransferase [Gallionella sp.]
MTIPYYMQPGDLPSMDFYRQLMEKYKSTQLIGIGEIQFKSGLEMFLQESRPDFIRFSDVEIQRKQSIEFKWGHDHDFGTFKLAGNMGTRHLKHLCVFHDQFNRLPYDLTGKKILDIGCWTGGVSLLLAACGAHVVAIDEVKKYCECLDYMAKSFGIRNLEVRNMSLYSLGAEEFQDAFDIVMFAGVLYHITDMIVGMRHIFNALKDGGTCLLESTGFRANEPVFGYMRRKWNWFDPSPQALHDLFSDVGFVNISVGHVTPDSRLYGAAFRQTHVDIRRDGLSVPNIR